MAQSLGTLHLRGQALLLLIQMGSALAAAVKQQMEDLPLLSVNLPNKSRTLNKGPGSPLRHFLRTNILVHILAALSNPDPRPGKAVEDAPSPLGPCTHVGNQEELQAPSFGLVQAQL